MLRILPALVVLALAGCGKDGSLSHRGLLGPDPSADLAAKAGLDPTPEFDPEDFVSGVDNPYFPLVPGTVFTYRQESEDGIETIVVEVTRQTKTILGVHATVVRDQVFLDGELIEDTFDWFAQDEDGNVWYL